MDESNVSSGGQNYYLVYRTKKKTGGYDFLDKLTDAVVAAPTPANAAVILELTEETAPEFLEGALAKTALTQYECGANLWDFLDKCAVTVSGAASVKEVPLENNKKIFGGSGGSEKLVAIGVHFADDYENPTKYFCTEMFGSVSEASGSFKTKSGEGVQPKFEFIGAKTDEDLIIPATAFPSLVTGAATTIKKNTCFKRGYLPKAA